MDKIKIKVIGVLKERDEKINNLEWTREWLKKYQHEFLNKENIRKELLFRSNEIYHLNCFFNITEKQFRYLVNILEPLVTILEPHRKKKSFSAEERISITLKYLATGKYCLCFNIMQNNWVVIIRAVDSRKTGIYLCKINSNVI